MKIMAAIRSDESQEIREASVDANTYEAGYEQLHGQLPDGWRMLWVKVDR